VKDYVSTLKGHVDLWEIGNEVNGEWLGKSEDVVQKITSAYQQVNMIQGKTALTLYFNQDCWEKADHEMFTWTAKYVPEYIKNDLDYVLISYYEDDCNGLVPDWDPVFDRLGKMFPNSKLGFGEIGTLKKNKKASLIQRYYGMNLEHPRFIGGYFWWYFYQDMIPSSSPLLKTLNDSL
jgi:hypothetical protein